MLTHPHVRSQQEGPCLEARKKVLTRNQPHWRLDLGLLGSTSVRIYVSTV